MEANLPVLLMRAVFASDVPRGSGLSSCASVEMAFVIVWQTLGSLKLPSLQLALLDKTLRINMSGSIVASWISLHLRVVMSSIARNPMEQPLF